MKIKMSLAVAVLLTNSALFADSTSILDTLKNSTINGDLGIYIKQTKYDDHNNGYGSGSFNLGYSTDSFYGFKLSAGSRANHAFWDNGGEYAPNAKTILHTANIAYSHQYFDVIFGRQEITNLDWIINFHEALVGVIKVAPDTTITVAYSQRIADANYDAPLRTFQKIGEDGTFFEDGLFAIDAKWRGIDGLVVNPFIYYANDVVTWAGARVDYDKTFSDFSVSGTAQYTQGKEKFGDDSSILHLEARGSFIGIDAYLGFVKTDKNGGSGNIVRAGETLNRFEDGAQLFKENAKTVYLGASYEFKDFVFNAIYGYTQYYSNSKFNDLELGTTYSLNDNLALEGLLILTSGNDEAGYADYTKVILGAVYSF
jgi:hypothetical protein